jgi:hypothetical protein
MYYALIVLCAAIAITDLWIVGGKTSATLVICFFAYAVIYKSVREQKMIASMIAMSAILGEVFSGIDAKREKIEDH